MEGVGLHTAIRAARGFPWKSDGRLNPGPYAVAVLIRCGLGAGLAVVCAASHQLAGPFSAALAGVAAPRLLTQLAQSASRTTGPRGGGAADAR
ncbi:hypothetical protein [Streptomyces sp. NPDC053079]|uniref:hypothetical protein n=1 Tax=Streptomyces sp. NPDC053079 TaxID=3365697 RepID=UPI0037CDE2D5